MAPDYSVILPARNAASDLGSCIAALGPAGGNPVPRELIVVDDGSEDGTAEVAEALGATVLRQAALGPAAARNAGAERATTELLVFMDADCVAVPGCIEALLAPFRDPRVAGARGGYTTEQRSVVARFVQLEMDEKQERLAASETVALLDTACAAYRRSVFLEYGGFDHRFPATSVEDAELSFRLVERGERLVYALGALVRHRHPEQLGRYLWRKLRFGYFRAQLYGRYPERVREDGYTPRLMPVQITLSGLMLGVSTASLPLGAMRPVALVAALSFLATTMPLVARALRTDPGIAALVPALLLARSLAQGLGLLAGLVCSPASWPALGWRLAGQRPRAGVEGRR